MQILIKSINTAIVASFFLIICPVAGLSQPTGDEQRRITHIVNSIRERIAESDSLIVKNPADAKLYGKRAELYVELYHSLYDRSYLSGFYGEISPELSVSAIASKAIADFNKALKNDPRSDFFVGRGEMYAVRWFSVVSALNWYEEMQQLEPLEWRDLINWQTLEKELKISEKVIRNPDFAAALSDYEQVLRLTNDPQLSEKTHQNLARLYLERSQRVVPSLQLSKESVLQLNSLNYSIFDDIDSAVAHIEKSNSGNEYRQSSLNPFHWFEVSRLTLRYALFYKASIAAFYDKNESAIQTLNEDEKYINKNEKFDELICSFYALRSSLYSKAGNFDAALADANVKDINRNAPDEICRNAYEPRGDAYFGEGDFSSAVSDYTMQMRETYGITNVPELYKKRGLAYLKMGDTKRAIVDYTYFINHGEYSPESYRLRAEMYRITGDKVRASADEKLAAEASMNRKINATKRAIYGKVIMPNGIVVDPQKVFVYLSHIGGRSQVWSPSVDEKGRFLFDRLPSGEFRLFAYLDGEKDGVAVRFYGLTDKLNTENKLVGPIILKLDRTVILRK